MSNGGESQRREVLASSGGGVCKEWARSGAVMLRPGLAAASVASGSEDWLQQQTPGDKSQGHGSRVEPETS